MAAAEGAVDAYTHVTGDKWKPYEPTLAGPATVGRHGGRRDRRLRVRQPGRGSQDPRPAAPSLRRPPLRWRPQAGRLAISQESAQRPRKTNRSGADKSPPCAQVRNVGRATWSDVAEIGSGDPICRDRPLGLSQRRTPRADEAVETSSSSPFQPPPNHQVASSAWASASECTGGRLTVGLPTFAGLVPNG